MTSPSKFQSSSDYSSTPAPLTGAKQLVLTTPASQYVPALGDIEYYSEITISEDFDTLLFILTCDEVPSICSYNTILRVGGATHIDACVIPVNNKARLVAVYTSIDGGTFTGSYTFRAVVIPIKSPYNQS